MDAASPALLDRRADRRGWFVRVADLVGFGLRDGADAAVVVDGALQGRVLGGLADDAIVAALADTEPERRLVEVTVGDDEAAAAGQVCGGRARLLATPIADLPDEFFDLLVRARPVALLTPLDPARAGELVVADRSVAGRIDADPEAAADTARRALADGRPTADVIEVGAEAHLLTVSVPATRLHLVGRGEMADAIVRQGELLGWAGSADEAAEPALTFLATAGPADAVVILSHDREVDVPVLAAALDSGVGYIGAMGSRRTQTARRELLAERGHTDLGRIHGPVGLDLGARTAPEVAVSIAAELLAVRGGRSGSSLQGVGTPIHG